ncbi:hypothetical protein DS901_11135 [Loktanella sp. D2R18]|uniref:hypothetical protein n=1 Tax=Rhodobacterales TaxID=204455 RepID=UPI000DE8A20A|nr:MULTISPECIES: hypothetical protein [Rhodobacterales]MDO6590948.1 hypothetical protein [Yoonia sp. 1_MG-2023]RBW43360.1 hypothetical protein DS901_11135 [Loktanella sp. D2R18]
MSDTSIITNKLAALLSDDDVYVAGARVIVQGGSPAPLAAVLTEIDATVLERTLVFSIDDVNVSMIVAGRRLRGFTDVSGNLPEAANVIGKVLSRDDAETLQAAGDLMLLLCASANRVTVRSLPATPFGTGADAGLSASGLATLWHINLDDKPAAFIERYLSANAADLSAYIYVSNGDVVKTVGDVATLDALWSTQVTEFRKRHRALLPKQDGPRLTCLDEPMGEGSTVAIAIDGNDVGLFSYKRSQMPRLVSAWTASLG